MLDRSTQVWAGQLTSCDGDYLSRAAAVVLHDIAVLESNRGTRKDSSVNDRSGLDGDRVLGESDTLERSTDLARSDGERSGNSEEDVLWSYSSD